MLALERQKLILKLLAEEGSVSVSALSARLSVTEETVRRDLEKLEKMEALIRTHGGAVPIDSGTNELSLEKRKSTHTDEKQRLAIEASKYIFPGDTIFLDASTTTFYIAKAIKHMTGVTVITNSLRIISELYGSDIKVMSVGGMVSKNQSIVGTVAEENIEKNYFANKMFFSSKGITENAGILESNETECAIKQKMLKNSGEKYYVCDSSKVNSVGCIKLASFDIIDKIITDADIGAEFERKLKDCNVELIQTVKYTLEKTNEE